MDAAAPGVRSFAGNIDRPDRAAPAGLSACGERQYKGETFNFGQCVTHPERNSARKISSTVGDHSTFWNPQKRQRLAERLSPGIVTVVKDGGLFIPMEQPEQTLELF